MRPLSLAVLAGVFAPLLGYLGYSPSAAAQERPTRAEVWDLRPGSAAEALPDGFAEYACGSNGGPPGAPLGGWRDFRRCRPEPDGRYEVYFRYDDELEYWAKANNFSTEVEQYSGTKVYGFPVVLSALFDAGGVLVGTRIADDPCPHQHAAGARRPTRCATSSPAVSAATAGTASIILPPTVRRL